MRIIETDILIVGGGIAGAALACALRNADYRTVVVEQREGVLDTARGDHLQPCNVEQLAAWGVLDRFFDRGAGKRIGHEFRTSDGEVLLAAKYDELPLPYPFFVVFNHDRIAELFLEIAAEGSSVSIFKPVSARKFEASENGIDALTVELPDGPARIVPRLVVGADGTNSAVRSALRFETDDYAYNHPMVALFGDRPADLKPDDYFFRYSGPTGMLVIQQRMDHRIKVTLPVGAEGIGWWKKSTPEQRADWLRSRAAILGDFDSEIAGFYPVKLIHSRQYVKGNTVLVGDAAHSIHPARGQGLNMGIYSLKTLLAHLPKPGTIGDPAAVRESLRAYQSEQKPRFDQILAKNHEAALAMDSTAEGEVERVLREQDHLLRRIDKDPELRRSHLLEATGYPFGIPGVDR